MCYIYYIVQYRTVFPEFDLFKMVGLLQWNIYYLVAACLWMRYSDVHCGKYIIIRDSRIYVSNYTILIYVTKIINDIILHKNTYMHVISNLSGIIVQHKYINLICAF